MSDTEYLAVVNSKTGKVEAPGFFSNMDCQNINGGKTTGVTIPNRIFNDTILITNLSNCFSGMKNIEYNLSSKGFINCSLKNVYGMFTDGNDSVVGKIPYGLLYQEHQILKKFIGINHADAISLGITDSNYGIDENWNWIADKPIINNSAYTETITEINKTINNMGNLFANDNSDNLTHYSIDMGESTKDNYGDLLVINPFYNPIQYIKNPSYSPDETIPNPNYNSSDSASTQTIANPNRDIHRVLSSSTYNPYKYMWNIYAVDGDLTTTEAILKNTPLYNSIESGNFNDVSPIIPDRMDGHSKYPARDGYGKISTNNYICPPDLFRYCNDSTSLVVTGMFYQTNFGGRIPPYLFEPIPSVTDITGMFDSAIISPYEWGYVSGDKGTQFYSDMFSNLKLLKSVNSFFHKDNIYANVSIPDKLFFNNKNLSNVSSLFSECVWGDSTNNQIPSNLFYNNSSLTDASSLFWGSNLPFIDGGLFTKERNPYLSNISSMFYGCSYVSGTVPSFWKWTNTIYSFTNVFYGVSKSKIVNSSDIPAQYSVGMNT
jgi:hypothetical protein